MATTSETSTDTAVHGGRLVARALRSRGVEHLFTLSGGHLFSIYDGCREEGIEIVDVRHEQAAVWAAEGYAKATRQAGRRRADRRARRDQRDERDRRRPLQPLAGHGPRRARARDALGLRLAPGDRPRPVRRAAGQVGGDRQGPGADRRRDRRGDRPLARGPQRADLPRLPARRRLHRGRGRARAPTPASTPASVAGRASSGRPSSSPAPSARRSWPAPASTGRAARTSCARWPRRSAPRCSSTAWAAAAFPPTTSSRSRAPAATA